MNPLLKMLLSRYMAPAGDDGTDTGGTAVADPDDDQYLSLPLEERQRLRGDSEQPPASSPPAQPAADKPAEQEEAPEPGAEGEDSRKGGHGIPRARFNEINEERKQLIAQRDRLQAELAAARGGAGQAPAAAPTAPAPAAPAFDVAAKEREYAQLMLEGDLDGATALRMEINQQIEEAAFARFHAAATTQQVQGKAQAAAESALAQFPWLNDPEGEEALEMIEAAVKLKVSRGMSTDQALSEAVASVAPRYAPAGSAPDQGLAPAAPAVDTRIERADRRGAAASTQQPASVQAGMGNRATAPQISGEDLSDDEYMNLPEKERKRLRGD